MDDWEKFNENSLLHKKIFTVIFKEDITDADYVHEKRVLK